MSDEAYILCELVITGRSFLSGSRNVACCNCNNRVWLSPATAARPDVGNAKPICALCAMEVLSKKKPEEIDVRGWNAEQVREVRAHWNKNGEFDS